MRVTWIRVRLKTLMVVLVLVVCALMYANVILPFSTAVTNTNSLQHHYEASGRIARIRPEDLAVVGRGLAGAASPVDSGAGDPAAAAGSKAAALVGTPAPRRRTVIGDVESQQPEEEEKQSRAEVNPERCLGTVCSNTKVQPVVAPASGGGVVRAPPSVPRVTTTTPHGPKLFNGSAVPARQIEPCGRECRTALLRNRYKRRRGGYAARVQVENVTLPESWNLSAKVQDRMEYRRQRVQQVCKKYGLDKRTKDYQPNAWEMLISYKYNLAWCNVFKAASSTWMYNFNIMAGYTEEQLLAAKDTPISLARKKYPRPTVDELDKVKNAGNKTLFFVIVRHPLHRLVSAFRDKLLSGTPFYSVLSRNIISQYGGGAAALARAGKRPIPTFPQFVQYLLDEAAKGSTLNEHWAPVSKFCTPCLVDFDVYAKMETLEEDGNYVIFTAGIEHIVKPKRINRARNEPTDAVAENFLCQLTSSQLEGLLQLYKYDMELFEYDAEKYKNCTSSTVT